MEVVAFIFGEAGFDMATIENCEGLEVVEDGAYSWWVMIVEKSTQTHLNSDKMTMTKLCSSYYM